MSIPHSALCFFMDGDMWCCVHGDFVNLQESPAGFGTSFDEALASLKESRDAPTETPPQLSPVAYRVLGQRWDGVVHYLIRMSNGAIVNRHEHHAMGLVRDYLADAVYDDSIGRAS